MSCNHWTKFKSMYKKKEQNKPRREVKLIFLLKGSFPTYSYCLNDSGIVTSPYDWEEYKMFSFISLTDIINLNKTTQDVVTAFGCQPEPNGTTQVLMAPHTLLAGHREI